jgi:hypothetical protein
LFRNSNGTVEAEEAGFAGGGGIGLKIDLKKARRELGIDFLADEIGLDSTRDEGSGVEGSMEVGEEDEKPESKKGKDKAKGKERKKLNIWRKELEDEYGAGLVVVLGDLAVGGIKYKLYLR